MSRRYVGFLSVAIGIFCVTLSILLNVSPVSATNTALESSITEKAALRGLFKCYQERVMKSEIVVDEYTGTIVNTQPEWRIALPFGKGSNFTCGGILGGTGGYYNGLYASSGMNLPPQKTDAAAVDTFLKGMGYDAKVTGDSETCATFAYASDNPSEFPDQQIRVCAELEGNNADPSISSIPSITMSEDILGVSTSTVLQQTVKITVKDSNIEICRPRGLFPCDSKQYVNFSNGKWTDFVNNFQKALAAVAPVRNIVATDDSLATFSVTYSLKEDYTVGEYNASTVYQIGNNSQDWTGAGSRAIDYLSTKYNYGTIILTDDEKVYLLQWDLTNYYKIDNYGCSLTGNGAGNVATGQGYESAYLYTDGSWQQCYIKPTMNRDKKVVGYNGNGYMDGTEFSYSDILNRLKDFRDAGTSVSENVDDSLDSKNDHSASTTDLCFKNGGILAWIACPAIEAVGTAVNGVYTGVVENFLEVKLDLSANSDNPLYEGWTVFRDVSNILFAIGFIVIILAQVTGIGISNYNIKKILPRFIMVVVLVNISFILCQLAVDVSNLLGSGLNNTFSDFANRVMGENPEQPFDLAKQVGAILAELGLAGGAAAGSLALMGLGSTAAIIASLPGWILMILITVIGCLIGIFFFFITLGVRQAAIALLVALAPVAIVCYALPNTKSFFDRWKKLFVALLMVYPIAGLLMGGGKWASAILISTKGENGTAMGNMFVIVAMLVQVVPFFFIPGLVRSSLSMIGNIGAKINGIGQGFRRGFVGRAKNSEAYKDFQHRVDGNVAKAKAKHFDRIKEKRGSLTKRQQMLRARAVRTADALDAEDIKNANVGGLLSESEDRMKALAAQYTQEEDAKEAAAKSALLNSDAGLVIEGINGGKRIHSSDIPAMLTAYRQLFEKIRSNPDSDHTDDLRTLQALGTTLASTTGGTRAEMRHISSEIADLVKNDASMDDAQKERVHRAIGKFWTNMNFSKSAADFAKDGDESKLETAILASGDFDNIQFEDVTMRDDNGQVVKTYKRMKKFNEKTGQYDGLAGSKLDGADYRKVAAFKPGEFDGWLDAAMKDELGSEQANQIIKIADQIHSAVDRGTLSMDADSMASMYRVASFLMSRLSDKNNGGNAPTDVNASTDISRRFSQLSDSTVSSIIEQIQSGRNLSKLMADISAGSAAGASEADKLRGEIANAEMKRVRGIADNIRRSLLNDEHTTESAQALQSALREIRAKGFTTDLSGETIKVDREPTRIKVTQSQPRLQMIQESDYTVQVDAGGGRTRTVRRSEATFDQALNGGAGGWKADASVQTINVSQARKEVKQANEEIIRENIRRGYIDRRSTGGGSGGPRGGPGPSGP